MKVSRVEQHRIKKSKKNNKDDKLFKIIDDLCWKSKNLYNYGNYIIRQEFIETSKQKEQGLIEDAHWIQYNELFQLCKESDCYKCIGSNVGQATLRKLDKNWKSFFAAIKDYSKNLFKYLGRPKLPKYLPKEDGRYELGLDNLKFKIVDGYIYFSWTPLKIMNNIFRTKIPNDSKLVQLRFVPKGNEYIMEVVYQIEVPETKDIESQSIAAIDLGVDNLMTITTNCGVNPIIINGKPLKSINQYYNKKISEMRSSLKLRNNSDWSNEMQRFTIKRNNQVDDYIQKSTKMVVDFCKSNDIDTLVCGYGKFGDILNEEFINTLDLVYNLADCVKQYDKHEADTLTAVADGRGSTGDIENVTTAITAVAEAYPELKSNENYKTLMNELSMTENMIAEHRSNYNKQVKEYKRYVRKLHIRYFLGLLGYEAQEYEYLDYNAPVDAPQSLFKED